MGADLSVTSGTVTFAANSAAGATQSITITATDDKLSETADAYSHVHTGGAAHSHTHAGVDTHTDAGGDAHTYIDAGGNVHSHAHT